MRCCATFVINSTINGNIHHVQVSLNLVGCFSLKKKTKKKTPFHRRLTVAEHVLLRNDLNQDEFAEAIQVLFHEGKYRNILLTGVAGCGKTLYNTSKLCFRTVL